MKSIQDPGPTQIEPEFVQSSQQVENSKTVATPGKLFQSSQELEQSSSGVVPEHFIYIGIVSAPENAAKRDIARSTFVTKLNSANPNGWIRAKFFIGHLPFNSARQGTKMSQTQLEDEWLLEQEAKKFQDIVRIALPESYQNLPDKTLQIFAHAVQAGYAFIVKLDDDQQPDLVAIQELAKDTNPQSLLYAGNRKWSPGDEDPWPGQIGRDGKFVQYMGGPCYMLSHKLARRIAVEDSSKSIELLPYGSASEDVDMGRWVNNQAHSEPVNITVKPISYNIFPFEGN